MLPQTEIEEIYSDNDILVVNKPSGIPTNWYFTEKQITICGD